MNIIGVDPGLDGFVACLDFDGKVLWIEPTPIVNLSKKGTKRDYDVAGMRTLLTRSPIDMADSILVVIEKQQAYPKQGVASSFTGGKGYGIWIGLVAGMQYPYSIVTPRKWTDKLYQGMAGDKAKGKSIIKAGQLFPKVDLRGSEHPNSKPNHNKSDSLLIAWYGLTEVLRVK